MNRLEIVTAFKVELTDQKIISNSMCYKQFNLYKILIEHPIYVFSWSCLPCLRYPH